MFSMERVNRQNSCELAIPGTVVNVTLQKWSKKMKMQGRQEWREQDGLALCLPCSEGGF